jgi:hypothetical protein
MLKVALLVGVEVHPGVAFEDLVEQSPEDAEESEFEMDIINFFILLIL